MQFKLNLTFYFGEVDSGDLCYADDGELAVVCSAMS